MSIKNTNSKRSPEGRWRKGTSGNPAGRPPGSRNKSTTFFEELLEDQGEALIQKAIELSLKGDTRALSICWDRLLPPRGGLFKIAVCSSERCSGRAFRYKGQNVVLRATNPTNLHRFR
jgi:Family of unknown function (DUF5681)